MSPTKHAFICARQRRRSFHAPVRFDPIKRVLITPASTSQHCFRPSAQLHTRVRPENLVPLLCQRFAKLRSDHFRFRRVWIARASIAPDIFHVHIVLGSRKVTFRVRSIHFILLLLIVVVVFYFIFFFYILFIIFLLLFLSPLLRRRRRKHSPFQLLRPLLKLRFHLHLAAFVPVEFPQNSFRAHPREVFIDHSRRSIKVLLVLRIAHAKDAKFELLQIRPPGAFVVRLLFAPFHEMFTLGRDFAPSRRRDDKNCAFQHLFSFHF
mmetsp:Transcript_8723/g.28045  ORF Transcript_8723/g.28045 Transcript_8723/m.28045 type:complete len:265 (+) Transcript_8723:2332-3126(+)